MGDVEKRGGRMNRMVVGRVGVVGPRRAGGAGASGGLIWWGKKSNFSVMGCSS